MCGHNSISNDNVLNVSASTDLLTYNLNFCQLLILKEVLLMSDNLFVEDEKMMIVCPSKRMIRRTQDLNRDQ